MSIGGSLSSPHLPHLFQIPPSSPSSPLRAFDISSSLLPSTSSSSSSSSKALLSRANKSRGRERCFVRFGGKRCWKGGWEKGGWGYKDLHACQKGGEGAIRPGLNREGRKRQVDREAALKRGWAGDGTSDGNGGRK